MPSLLKRRLFGGVIALSGALLAVWLQTPLPWLLGPLITVAAFRLASLPVACSVSIRCVGQWAIGAALGLYFTPQIVEMISQYWVLALTGMIFALILAGFGTLILHKIGGADIRTSWFASAIGSASEMTVLSERYGGRVDLVASAHSLRILMVVVIIPFAFQVLGITGDDLSLIPAKHVYPLGLLLLVALTVLGGYLFQWLGVSNSWVLGPLCVSMLLTISGIHLSSMPDSFSMAGQLFIGWALGDKYRPAFFRAAPRFLASVFLFTALALMFALGVSHVVSMFTTISQPTLLLGFAPGGIAEMAITAKVLNLGVPLVIALQVSRMFLVVMVTGPIFVHLVNRLFPSLDASVTPSSSKAL